MLTGFMLTNTGLLLTRRGKFVFYIVRNALTSQKELCCLDVVTNLTVEHAPNISHTGYIRYSLRQI